MSGSNAMAASMSSLSEGAALAVVVESFPETPRWGPGENSPWSGFEGAEPLASPNVLRWVGWLSFITRCGPAPLSPPRNRKRAWTRSLLFRRT